MKKLILAVALTLSGVVVGQDSKFIPQEERIANNLEMIFNDLIDKKFKSVENDFYKRVSDTSYYQVNGLVLNIYEQSGDIETINGNHMILRNSTLSKWIDSDTVTDIIYDFSNIHSPTRNAGNVSSEIILILKSGRNIQLEIVMSLGYISAIQIFNNYAINPEFIIFNNY